MFLDRSDRYSLGNIDKSCGFYKYLFIFYVSAIINSFWF